MKYPESGEKPYFIFQPTFEPKAHELIAKGEAVSGLSVGVKVRWTDDNDESREQSFVYADSFVNKFVQGWNTTTPNKYTGQFNLKITDAENYEGLSYEVVINTSLGVQIAGEEFLHPII